MPTTSSCIARAYWAFLRRMSLGIIRVEYAPASRTVAAFGRIPLLRFGAPDLRGRVAASAGSTGRSSEACSSLARVAARAPCASRSSAAIGTESTTRPTPPLDPVRLIATVEVENFYPGIRGRGRFARFGAWFYAQTQLRIHVLICNAFLRSIPRLDFPAIDRSAMPERARRLGPRRSDERRRRPGARPRPT